MLGPTLFLCYINNDLSNLLLCKVADRTQERTLELILQNEDQDRTLSTVYDEIARDRQLVTVTAHATTRGVPISIFLHQVSCHELFIAENN